MFSRALLLYSANPFVAQLFERAAVVDRHLKIERVRKFWLIQRFVVASAAHAFSEAPLGVSNGFTIIRGIAFFSPSESAASVQ